MVDHARQPRGATQVFLDALRSFESGIDPTWFDWYCAKLDEPVLAYPLVERPGRLVRDRSTGQHVMRPVTIRDYFRDIGVLAYFDPADPACLAAMQYRSMNAWGYIGYQLGEHVLIDNGYYSPAIRTVPSDGRDLECPSYCRSAPVGLWADGVRETAIRCEATGELVLVTDVNCWQGRFLGKDDVHSFSDLIEPALQERVIRRVISNNLAILSSLAAERDNSLEALLDASWQRVMGDGELREVRGSLSGAAAACHLCGAQATFDFLASGVTARDELGTELLDYMDRFGHHDIYDLVDGPGLTTSDPSETGDARD